MRVRLASNYASSEQLVSEVVRQWKPINGMQVDWSFDDTYDRLFIFNYWERDITVSKENIFVVAQEPEWSRNYRNYNGKCKEFISPTNGNYPIMFYHHGLAWDEVEAISPIKKKKLSFICAKGPEIDGTLYAKRNELFLALANSDIDIDLFGRGWDANLPKYKGPLDKKAEGLIDYEFSVCCENYYQPFYTTEKYHDVVACKGIPIDVTDAINKGSVNEAMDLILEMINNKPKLPLIQNGDLMQYINSKL